MELSCPNCGIKIEVKTTRNNQTICPKCLEAEGKRFIMIEHNDGIGYTDLGDGFFQRNNVQ